MSRAWSCWRWNWCVPMDGKAACRRPRRLMQLVRHLAKSAAGLHTHQIRRWPDLSVASSGTAAQVLKCTSLPACSDQASADCPCDTALMWRAERAQASGQDGSLLSATQPTAHAWASRWRSSSLCARSSGRRCFASRQVLAALVAVPSSTLMHRCTLHPELCTAL